MYSLCQHRHSCPGENLQLHIEERYLGEFRQAPDDVDEIAVALRFELPESARARAALKGSEKLVQNGTFI